MKKDLPVLIVAKSGRWRDSLQVLLRAIGGIKLLAPTENIISALSLIATYSTIVILLDFNLPDDEAWALLKQVKTDYPKARCLALIESDTQKQLVQAAGVDGTLLAGFNLEMLQVAIEKIVQIFYVEDIIEGWLARAKQEAQIIAKAMTDEAYRQALLANPKTLVEREIGIQLPETLQVIVHEETLSSWHIVLPAPATEELSDEAMDQVAGGLDNSSFTNTTIITDTFKLAGDRW
jgi:DNA-binding NarL/FixJ family response regulator